MISLFIAFLACEPGGKVNPVYFDVDDDGYTEDVDCDDENAAIHPDADEICDGQDNDCDELVDDADDSLIDPLLWYADEDGDGYGDLATERWQCESPSAHVDNADDCDDENAAIHPDADEICDDKDNDCDELVDDADDSLSTELSFYKDLDGDGYGDESDPLYACVQPGDRIPEGGDCDDSQADVNPDSQEVCDGIDNDCDALIDIDDDSVDLSSSNWWWLDMDGDGQGDASSGFQDCEQPANAVDNQDDCDDESAGRNSYDLDGDGLSSCMGDCNDQDPAVVDCLSCVEHNLYSDMGYAFHSDTLSGVADWGSGCGSGAERVYRWVAPNDGLYRFGLTANFLPTLSIWEDCGSVEAECVAGYELLVNLLAGEEVLLAVGAEEEGAGGDYSLSIGQAFESDCSDGQDGDGDGLIDCQDEADCWFASECAMSTCPNFHLLDPLSYEFPVGDHLMTGDLSLASDDRAASCETSSGPESSFYWEASETGCARFVVTSDDMDVAISLQSECMSAELDCATDSAWVRSLYGTNYGAAVEVDVFPNDSVILFVDGEGTLNGSFGLSVLLETALFCDGTPIE